MICEKVGRYIGWACRFWGHVLAEEVDDKAHPGTRRKVKLVTRHRARTSQRLRRRSSWCRALCASDAWGAQQRAEQGAVFLWVAQSLLPACSLTRLFLSLTPLVLNAYAESGFAASLSTSCRSTSSKQPTETASSQTRLRLDVPGCFSTESAG